MELRRGEEVIEPIHPGRVKEAVSVGDQDASLTDIAHYGIYEYPPEAIREAATLTLYIWKQGVPEPIVIPIDGPLQAKLRGDFAPYFEHLARSE